MSFACFIINRWGSFCAGLINLINSCSYSTESMNQNARLLELNPDFLTAWNYRKRAVQHLWELEESDRKRIAQTELDVVHCRFFFHPKFTS